MKKILMPLSAPVGNKFKKQKAGLFVQITKRTTDKQNY